MFLFRVLKKGDLREDARALNVLPELKSVECSMTLEL